MSPGWLILLLPLAAASGWFASLSSKIKNYHVLRRGKDINQRSHHVLSQDYLPGLNFLLNEQSDKALDFFLEKLEINQDTFETHLSLGNLFCRRGEVTRAIRIHNNLVTKSNLAHEYRLQALFALAKDYLCAGLLDQAERIFLDLTSDDEYSVASMHCLLDIYQQEKEWQKALVTAEKLIKRDPSPTIKIATANYCCELAEIAIKQQAIDLAIKHLNKALSFNHDCVRANLLLAEIKVIKGDYKLAINYLKQTKGQNPAFFSEAILPLANAYRVLGEENELITYLREVLKEFPRLPIVLLLSEQIRKWRGDKMAANFVAEYVRQHPSVSGVHRLVELHLNLTHGEAHRDLLILRNLTEKLLADQPVYRCENCGFTVKSLEWYCRSCKQWETTKPTHMFE